MATQAVRFLAHSQCLKTVQTIKAHWLTSCQRLQSFGHHTTDEGSSHIAEDSNWRVGSGVSKRDLTVDVDLWSG